MRRLAGAVFLWALTAPVGADAAFWDRARGLLDAGRFDEVATLAQTRLDAFSDDADALVVAGTATLYQRLELRRNDSIFRSEAEPAAPPTAHLNPAGADAVAAFWKRVPALDPSRAYLWGDLAQLAFRAGDSARAVEYARQALATPSADAEALRAAASVFALTLDWPRAAQALALIPGNRTALLYQGLSLWRTGKDGWRVPLKAFVDDPGTEPSGAKLAAYLLGPAMRDNEGGFLEALKTENSVATLAVKQKYVERYPNKFLPRLDLARSLSQFGSYATALLSYDEIDRRGLATNADERQAVLFQQAWAQQASGRFQEASRLWDMLSTSKDFYLRSAACWFLGANAVAGGKAEEAKPWWSRVADEPARSKYAYWADEELKKLR